MRLGPDSRTVQIGCKECKRDMGTSAAGLRVTAKQETQHIEHVYALT